MRAAKTIPAVACAMLLVWSANPGAAQLARPTEQRVQPALPGPTKSAADDGAGLFGVKCGYCHLPGGTGTMMLGRRLGADNALLAKRRDLSTAYVQGVVRHGIGSMPALTRVEVDDRQLDLISTWLADGRRRNRDGKR